MRLRRWASAGSSCGSRSGSGAAAATGSPCALSAIRSSTCSGCSRRSCSTRRCIPGWWHGDGTRPGQSPPCQEHRARGDSGRVRGAVLPDHHRQDERWRDMSAPAAPRKNKLTVLILVSVVLGMLGLTAAAVPLYDLFCRVTGYGGTTQRAEAAPEQQSDQTIEIRFNADVARHLPWSFAPVERAVRVRIGETHLAFYRAHN